MFGLGAGKNINRDMQGRVKTSSEVAESLAFDKLLLLGAAAGVLAAAAILMYNTFATDRLEQVFLTQDIIDAPTLLEKVRTSQSEVYADRHVRGFVRRFVSYFFVHPDDTSEFAKQSLEWIHAHSSDAGRKRSEVLLLDFDKYDKARRSSFASFYPVNDPSTLKISVSRDSSDLIYVTQPGTYVTKNSEGEAFFDASLELMIKRQAVTGLETIFGKVNVVGYVVDSAIMSFRQDNTKQNEITRKALLEGY